ncbi:spore coat U domain-containing protein [Oceanospirillaceae bacterium]|nr:spore coat U domain-containing protein [Oceanospirillaceae bacterium]
MSTNIGQRSLHLAIISTIALSTAALTAPAYADATANLDVSASVSTSCTISSTDLSFGTYDGIVAHASQDLTETATITTTCTTGSIVVITMGGGHHGHYLPPSRHMKNGGSNSYLKYEIYADAGHTFVWSYDRFRMSSVASVDGSGASQDITVYGKVFKNQRDAVAGIYTDTVSIGVNY